MPLIIQIHGLGNANNTLNALSLTNSVYRFVLYQLIIPPYSLLSLFRVDTLNSRIVPGIHLQRSSCASNFSTRQILME